MREHLRNKFLTAQPETKEWRDGDGDLVVLVAPSDASIREDYRQFQAGKLRDEEWGARLIVLMAHEPKTSTDGEVVTRNGKAVPGEPIFTDRDTKALVEQPIGSVVGKLRDEAIGWLPELTGTNRSGPDRDELVDIIKRSVEIIDGGDGYDHNKRALESIRERFSQVLNELEGND